MRLCVKAKSFTGLVLLGAILLLTEVASRFGALDPRFFPPPSAVIGRVGELLLNRDVGASGDFHQHLAASATKFGVALLIAAMASLVLTVIAGLNKTFRTLVSGVIGFLYPLPKSAVFPFLLLVFGIGGGAHIALIAMGAVALMLATAVAGLQRLEAAGYMEIVRILQLKTGAVVRKVLLPGLLPEFMHGIKLGASYGLFLLIVSEMLVTRFGLGVFLWAAWDQFKVLDLYAVLYLISGLGFVIFGVFDALGEKFADSQRSV